VGPCWRVSLTRSALGHPRLESAPVHAWADVSGTPRVSEGDSLGTAPGTRYRSQGRGLCLRHTHRRCSRPSPRIAGRQMSTLRAWTRVGTAAVQPKNEIGCDCGYEPRRCNWVPRASPTSLHRDDGASTLTVLGNSGLEAVCQCAVPPRYVLGRSRSDTVSDSTPGSPFLFQPVAERFTDAVRARGRWSRDRKSTRLNSSHW
jgi:hypothetical protein